MAEQFLSNTATQLTYHGLCELTSTVQEGELCVFFRNNHFSTMIKYKVRKPRFSVSSTTGGRCIVPPSVSVKGDRWFWYKYRHVIFILVTSV